MQPQQLKPLPPEDWPAELQAVLDDLGAPLNIHNVMAHNGPLTLAWMPFRHYIVANSSLAPRLRELLILRVAVNTGADYEWAHHVQRGRAAGLMEEEIDRVRNGPDDPSWTQQESILLRAGDECCRTSQISPATLVVLAAHFDAPEQLDIIATVGMYLILAMMIKSYDVPLEDA
jgi:alkylhydroperoxidase family enzyme